MIIKYDLIGVSDNFHSNLKIDKERIYFITFYDRSPDLCIYAPHLAQKAQTFKHSLYFNINN